MLWFSAGALVNKIHGGNDSKIGSADGDLIRAGTFLIGVFFLVQHTGILVGRYTSSGDFACGSALVLVVSFFMAFRIRFLSLHTLAKNILEVIYNQTQRTVAGGNGMRSCTRRYILEVSA